MPAETKPQTARRSRREELLEFIAQEKARLARFEAEEADCRNRLGALQAELESLSVEPAIRARLPLVAETPPPKTSVEKVKVFRSLFRGREDVGLGDAGGSDPRGRRTGRSRTRRGSASSVGVGALPPGEAGGNSTTGGGLRIISLETSGFHPRGDPVAAGSPVSPRIAASLDRHPYHRQFPAAATRDRAPARSVEGGPSGTGDDM